MIKIKGYLTIQEQVELLKNNNLEIKDGDEDYLIRYGFRTLIHGFGHLFMKDGIFENRTTLNDIYTLFLFEKDLSAILRESMSKFEHSIKAAMSQTITKHGGLFGHMSTTIFKSKKLFNKEFTHNRLSIIKAESRLESSKEHNDYLISNKAPTILLIDDLMMFDLITLFSLLNEPLQMEILEAMGSLIENPNKAALKFHAIRAFRNRIDHNKSIHLGIRSSVRGKEYCLGDIASILSQFEATKDTMDKLKNSFSTENESDESKIEWLNKYYGIENHKPSLVKVIKDDPKDFGDKNDGEETMQLEPDSDWNAVEVKGDNNE